MATVVPAGFRAVVARELRHLGRAPWDQALLLWLPAATLLLLLWVFTAGVPVGLPVAVVDQDNSAASRDLVRRIAATRGVAVALRPTSLEAAQPAVRSGAVYAVVHIPADWERDRLRGAPSPVALYGNAQFFLVAGIVGGDVRAAVSSMAFDRAVMAEARFGDGLAHSARRVDSVQADLRTLFDPALSYEVYLGGTLIPAILHLFCVVAAVSALGREFRDRTVGDWLRAAAGRPAAALLGKLAPVAVVYLGLALATVATLAGWRGWPAAGSLGLWLVAIAMLMLASMTIAVLMVGATANLRAALSLTGLYVATGIAFSGFSFPRAAMNDLSQGWGSLLPFTHYLPLQQGQWLGAAPPGTWAQGMAGLALFVVVPLAAGVPLLGRALRQPARWGHR
ncbi:MAG: ABC transporter permease [Betaproteobacteria bacterium]